MLVWIKRLVAFRFLILFLRAFLPFQLPEVWRQYDTMGVALRFWNRWTIENGSEPWFLPAVLQSGDTRGVMPMEFPLLNMITAPCFALGPYWGRSAAMILLFAILLGLTLFNTRVWRGKKILGIDAEAAMWLLPILSLGADWSGKFMPDFLAMNLVTIAVGLSWTRATPWSLLFALLGFLIKPSSFPVLFLYGVQPEFRWHWKRQLAWIAPALAVTFLYYTEGIAFIQSYLEMPSLFFLERPPLGEAIRQYLSDPKTIFQFLTLRTFFPWGIVLVFIILRFNRMWAVFAVQLLAIGALAGSQAHTHPYYFMAITPTMAILFWQTLQKPSLFYSRALLMAGLVIRVLDLSAMDLRPLYQPAKPSWVAAKECDALIKRHPELPWKKGVAFRSSYVNYPELGLCFGERENSTTSRYGFYWVGTQLPAGCRTLDRMTAIEIVECP